MKKALLAFLATFSLLGLCSLCFGGELDTEWCDTLDELDE